MSEYTEVQRRLARGWNTWNTRSVLSHVHLPEGLALNLGLKEYAGGAYLKEALIGRRGQGEEVVRPGPHAVNGSYTEINLSWRGIEVRVQSATDDNDLLLLVTPLTNQKRSAVLVAEGGILWNRPGYVRPKQGALVWRQKGHEVYAYGTREAIPELNVATQGPYLAMPLCGPLGISTGKKRSLEEIQALVEDRRLRHLKSLKEQMREPPDDELAEVRAAIQTCLAWDTIYEPTKRRVISPVSRIWNVNWGGYVLFCWDTYFAAYIMSLGGADEACWRDLAYANAIEITREKTEAGFVPNFATVNGVKSRDRSQPPVGGMVVRELYRRWGDKWLLKEVFSALLEWNRWWPAHRAIGGLLAWGSDPYEPTVDARFEKEGVNALLGAAYESGLDNSPMYDGMGFDSHSHLMQLADVGLNGLYIMDCEALAEIAEVLDRKAEVKELHGRAQTYRERLGILWDETSGIFRNCRTDTGEFSPRLSPTSFYALLGRAATQAQAERMVREHFYNPHEFWGQWIMPTIARNDPAYADQDYWRGRIWAPMNLLVYLGLRRYDLPGARANLAKKSRQLLLKEWREHGHIHENYSGDTGEGCDKPNSDAFYHWGGLLGLIALIEEGYLEGPEKPII